MRSVRIPQRKRIRALGSEYAFLRMAIRESFCLELAPMTPQDIKAMVAAGCEYDDAVKAFDTAIQKPESKTEISKAFHAMLAKHKALQAFGQ